VGDELEWKVGEIAFQPNHGVVGRVAALSTLPRDGMEALPTLKLESGDELLAAGCVRGTNTQLSFHDGAIAALSALLKELARNGMLAGISPQTVVCILAGVVARQDAHLTVAKEGSNDHQAEQGLPDRG